jgi:nonsense-mediated mRNA decay protein 3
MCVNCIRSQVDITEGMQKQITILWCKECGRYLQPPKHWVRAEPESKELLTFCIKRVKGLQVGASHHQQQQQQQHQDQASVPRA